MGWRRMKKILEDLLPFLNYATAEKTAKLVASHKLFQDPEFIGRLFEFGRNNRTTCELFVDRIGKVKGLTFELTKHYILIESADKICKYWYNPIDRLLEKVNK